MNQKNLDILSKSHLFFDMSLREIDAIYPCLNPILKTYKKGEIIIKMGQRVERFGIILEGRAHLIQEDYWGNKMIISDLIPSDVFAEVFATLSIKSEVTVVAVEDTKVLMLNVEDMTTTCSKACNYHDKLIKNLLKSIANKNLKMTQKLNHISKKSIRGKLLSYLSNESLKNDNSKFEIPFNRQDLADYLGVDRSALSNEISKLKKEGIIDSKKNYFELIKNNYEY